MTPAARIGAAIELLEAVENAPRRPADAVANDFFRARRFIGSGDRRAVGARVWAVLRTRRRLGWWLARIGLQPAPRLLVAASLLLEGWATEGVAQSFSGGRFAPAALDAATLGRLREMHGRTELHPEMDAATRLEVPAWLLPSLQQRFGGALDAEMDALSQPATLDIRANLLQGSREAARAALLDEGHESEATALSPWGLRLPARRSITTGAAFQTGLVEIQDEGSQLVAALVDARPGMRVADWCAGAAGKTLALAAAMENRGYIAACDVSAPRLEAALRRLRRAGVSNVERHHTQHGDKWVKRRAGTFDRVLVDAPCTGTGTWRRNPDGRLRLAEQDLRELVPRQAAILDEAAPLVRTGGHLVYATCSLLLEENEAQVSAFLSRHPGFAVLPLAQAWRLDGPPPAAGPFLSLTPRQHGTDGFFAAVLVRAA